MKCLKPGAVGAFAAADARHERGVAEQAAAEHERGKRWIAFDRFPYAALTDQIAVIADRHGAARQGGGEGVLADAALVKVLPHARMNDQLRNRIAAVNLEQRLKFRRIVYAEPCLDGDRNRAGGENGIQKAVKLVGMGEKACALALRGHGARRAAEIEVDLGIAERGEGVRRPDKVGGRPGEQLRHGRHAFVVFGQHIALLTRRQLFLRRRGDERHEIFVDAGEKFVVGAAEYCAGDALHRGKVIVHAVLLGRFTVRAPALPCRRNEFRTARCSGG